MAASSNNVLSEIELGFAESISENWKLNSKFFPSKIGGKPSWLDLRRLPSSVEIKCTLCQNPLVFLMQVYAPIENNDSAFHRTIFLFVCKTPECLKKSNTDGVLALRCQMPRQNDCYSFEPPAECPVNAESPSSCDFNKLCNVCGCLGNKSCGKCHIRNYCGVEHQSIDWKSGHKFQCGENAANNKIKGDASSFLLKEYELVRETEVYEDGDDDEDAKESQTDKYNNYLALQNASNLSENKLGDLESIAQKSDKAFKKFRKRTANEPNQVLRYQRRGEPLWVSSDNLPDIIPPCSCGSPRTFEFQVMPQLLNYLQLDTFEDSIDWGIIAVYTCLESCSSGPAYQKEFIWKQDFSPDNKE